MQEGILELSGRQLGFDGSLENFAAEMVSVESDRYRGSLEARRATLKLRGAEPLVTSLSTRFTLDSARGITFEGVDLAGAFGRLHASGALETFGAANAVFHASGDVSVDEVERIFHSALGFSGGARVDARIEIPPAGGFRIAADRRRAPGEGEPIHVREHLRDRRGASRRRSRRASSRAGYAGGKATGVLRIGNLTWESPSR